MEHNTDVTRPQASIPPVIWFLGIGLAAAAAAVFIFNVAMSTVAYYGLLAFMIGSHFFMHGSHGAHGNHAGQQNGQALGPQDKSGTDHRHGTGGCH